MCRRPLSLMRLLVVPLVLPASVTWGEATPIGVGTIIDTHGVELAVTVPRQHYPRNALVKATVRLTNLSAQALEYFPGCANDNPEVLVYRYDPLTPRSPLQAFPGILQHILVTPPCLPGTLTVDPGQSVWKTEYVILGGRYVEGRAILGGLASESVVTTPQFRVSLARSDPPGITLRTSRSVYTVIRPAQKERLTGPMLYVQAYACPAAEGAGTRQPKWTPLESNRLAPACPHPLDWYVFVGLPGHSVASIQYQRPRQDLRNAISQIH